VIGTGHVGLVVGTCLAEIGHKVVCQDVNERKIGILKEGEIPIYEPYLKNLVRENAKEGRLNFTIDTGVAITQSDVIFICVGTSPLENGETDLSAVEKVSRQIAKFATTYKLVVEKSTVPVQTGEQIKRTLDKYNTHSHMEFDVASNPEFLREGSAIQDFLHPDRIVVGVENSRAEKILREIYLPITNQSFDCPIHINCPRSQTVPLLVCDIKSAELIKHASNSFLATKISFINAVADICERAGADVTKVADGMGLDPRIGRSFLNAGIGFGGFCFPKDLQAFVKFAQKLGCEFSLLKEVEKINENRIDVILNKIKQELWVIKQKTIGILGLSFKPNTDDIRFAPSVKIIHELQKEGANIKAYDPKAMDKVKEVIPDMTYCNGPYEVATDSDALVIVTEYEEFKSLDFLKIKSLMRHPLIIDGRNLCDKEKLIQFGFKYYGIGR